MTRFLHTQDDLHAGLAQLILVHQRTVPPGRHGHVRVRSLTSAAMMSDGYRGSFDQDSPWSDHGSQSGLTKGALACSCRHSAGPGVARIASRRSSRPGTLMRNVSEMPAAMIRR